ncbi:MFS transporter [Mycolicibacterium cosmeticum]|uniref:MFS transporter n=1 Tax=Mycolicibacterium cosmeticum TaxID=258533 RepID=UPI003204E5B3
MCRLSQAAAGPLWGRFADRHSLRSTVVVATAAQLPTLAVLVVAPLQPWSLLVMAAATGALLLPTNPLMRALWLRSVRTRPDQDSAGAFESVMNELVLLCARSAVAALALVLSIRAAVLLLAVLLGLGCIGMISTRLLRADRPPADAQVARRTLAYLWAGAGLFASFLLFAASLGAYSLVLLVVFDEFGPSAPALAIAVWGAGSIVGMAVLRLQRVTAITLGVAGLLVAMAALQLVGLLASGAFASALVAAGASGLPIAAIVTGLYHELGSQSSGPNQSEVLAWAGTMIIGGDALGALLAGLALDRLSTAASISIAAGCALAAAGLLVARRSRRG